VQQHEQFQTSALVGFKQFYPKSSLFTRISIFLCTTQASNTTSPSAKDDSWVKWFKEVSFRKANFFVVPENIQDFLHWLCSKELQVNPFPKQVSNLRWSSRELLPRKGRIWQLLHRSQFFPFHLIDLWEWAVTWEQQAENLGRCCSRKRTVISSKCFLLYAVYHLHNIWQSEQVLYISRNLTANHQHWLTGYGNLTTFTQLSKMHL